MDKSRNTLPDNLAMEDGHVEEKWVCRQEIPDHLSCLLFFPSEHVH